MDRVLKQRLVGASILIALAVIFVPMLFDSDDSEPQRRMDIDLPEPPEGDLDVRRLPMGEQADNGRTGRDDSRARRPVEAAEAGDDAPDTDAGGPDRDTSRPDPEPIDSPEAEVETPVADESITDELEPVDDEPETDSESAAKPDAETPGAAADGPPEPVAAETSADGDWIVQVASFSAADTAGEISDRLGALGHAAMIDVVVRGDGRLHRVRVGPFETRAGAERTRQQIARTVDGVSPVVLSVSGAQTDAGDQSGRWAVQVGSFAGEDNADRLRDRLRELGFTTFVHREISGGRAIWKVRVGPILERDEAEDMLARLNDEAGVEGLVVAHP